MNLLLLLRQSDVTPYLCALSIDHNTKIINLTLKPEFEDDTSTGNGKAKGNGISSKENLKNVTTLYNTLIIYIWKSS